MLATMSSNFQPDGVAARLHLCGLFEWPASASKAEPECSLLHVTRNSIATPLFDRVVLVRLVEMEPIVHMRHPDGLYQPSLDLLRVDSPCRSRAHVSRLCTSVSHILVEMAPGFLAT